MSMYSKILVALDFHTDNRDVVDKAAAIAKDNDAELYLIHIIEPLALAYGIENMSWGEQIVSLESGIRREAEAKMARAAEKLSVPQGNCIVRQGRPATEIHDIAKEKDIDLIVLGTHGQSGLQLLLGSTANSVLHGSTCDVLSVRIGQ